MNESKIVDILLKTFRPIFSKYLTTVLFLNQTEIYLNMIKDVKMNLNCYLLNTSGQIHPFLFGAACDLGLKIETPVVGYTKKLLFGEFRENEKYPTIPEIYHGDRLIGYAIPKPNSKKYLYISVGNNIILHSALKIFLKLNFKIFSKLRNELSIFIHEIDKNSIIKLK